MLKASKGFREKFHHLINNAVFLYHGSDLDRSKPMGRFFIELFYSLSFSMTFSTFIRSDLPLAFLECSFAPSLAHDS